MDTLTIIAQRAADYSGLVNIVLTVFIVCLTAWYAIVTRRMWKEMVESRLTGIRPLLDIKSTTPELRVASDDNERIIAGSITIHNFGRGPAYALYGEVQLPYESEREITYISTELKEGISTKLLPGESFNCQYRVYGFPTPFDASRESFLRVTLLYRDAEGNYYTMIQNYSLLAIKFGSVISRTLPLHSEKVWFSPFSRFRRRETGSYPTPSEMILVAEQRNPRWRKPWKL